MDASGLGGLEMTEQEQSEVQQLRAQVASLEAELVETQARTNAIVAQTQERVYWLDRWHLDLNALMRRPGAAEVRASLRAVRWLFRRSRNLKRRTGLGTHILETQITFVAKHSIRQWKGPVRQLHRVVKNVGVGREQVFISVVVKIGDARAPRR